MGISNSYNYNANMAKSYKAQTVSSRAQAQGSAQSVQQDDLPMSQVHSFQIEKQLSQIAQRMQQMGRGVVDATPFIQAMYFDVLIMPLDVAVDAAVRAFIAACQDAGIVPTDQPKEETYGQSLMRRGQELMDTANSWEPNMTIGVVESAIQSGRGFSTSDACGGSGLILYGVGALLDWIGL